MRIANHETSTLREKAAAARKVQALLRQLQGESWALESARILSYEELRCLALPRGEIDLILRRVAEARSKSELLSSLDGFVLSLFSGDARRKTLSSRLLFIKRLFKDRRGRRCF